MSQSRLRSALAMAVVSVAAALTACGGGSPSAPATSSAAARGEEAPPPPPKSVGQQTFAGTSLSDKDLEQFVAKLNAALKANDEKGFMASVDPKGTSPVNIRQWFRNVQTVPMSVRQVAVVRSKQTSNSSSQAVFDLEMAFRHAVQGADPAAIDEWYSVKVLKKGSNPPLLTSMAGAPASEDDGQKYSRYFPAAWDEGMPVAAVSGRSAVLVGAKSDEARMRRMLPEVERAVRDDYAMFARAGQPVPAAQQKLRWVFTLQSTKVKDIFQYFGGTVTKREANFVGVATPIFASDVLTGYLKDGQPSVTSRITLGRSMAAGDSYYRLTRHEVVHAIAERWNNGDFRANPPRWVIEGLATYAESDDQSRNDWRLQHAKAAVQKKLFTDQLVPKGSFYNGGNDVVDQRYGFGYAAVRYVMETQGEKKGMAAMKAIYADGTDAYPAFIRPKGADDEAAFIKAVSAWVVKQ